jgi:two-component system response regulator (stage 0 sporulation protein A)
MIETIMTSKGSVHDKVSKILRECNVRPHLSGFTYLKEAIVQVYSGVCTMRGVTKTLYPAVARIYDTTPPAVERAMRHAITYAWERSKSEPSIILDDLFRYPKRFTIPTITEFVATVVESMHRYAGI